MLISAHTFLSQVYLDACMSVYSSGGNMEELSETAVGQNPVWATTRLSCGFCICPAWVSTSPCRRSVDICVFYDGCKCPILNAMPVWQILYQEHYSVPCHACMQSRCVSDVLLCMHAFAMSSCWLCMIKCHLRGARCWSKTWPMGYCWWGMPIPVMR